VAELDDPRRLAAFKTTLLDLDGDAILQRCVETAAERAAAPIALVSFVMKTVVFFRAAIGLPPELDITRATSRSDLFCQFVVKTEGPFIVNDARSDARVPQVMVDAYGILAYLGVPVRVDGHILGSLCVVDGTPRQWSPVLVEEILDLARHVSGRLQTLASLDTSGDLTLAPPSGLAVRAALLAQVVRRSLSEIGPIMRLARSMKGGISPDAVVRAGSVLTEASASYDEMVGVVAALCAETKRLERAFAKPPAGA
jgi:GAF domain-containing protein